MLKNDFGESEAERINESGDNTSHYLQNNYDESESLSDVSSEEDKKQLIDKRKDGLTE